LAVKLLNASKFALAELPAAGETLAHPLDRALIARLSAVAAEATASFEDYDYARALERAESFFWWYCDYYVELVKGRRYDPNPEVSASVSRALRLSQSVLQRLLAPFLPFVCEEVWSWWQQGSVHRAPWPDAAELLAEVGEQPEHDREDVLKEVRKAKSEAQVKMRAPVRRVVVHDTPERLRALELGLDDLREAGTIERIETVEAEEFAVEVELAEETTVE
jgi:valyl-tRNA synthetase